MKTIDFYSPFYFEDGEWHRCMNEYDLKRDAGKATVAIMQSHGYVPIVFLPHFEGATPYATRYDNAPFQEILDHLNSP